MRNFLHFAQPLFGEEEKKEIIEALDSGWVTLGPRTKQFEEDCASYLGSKFAVALTSCTAGLHLSLLAAGIGEGDEVITTIFTFAATSNTIIHVGANPVFVDITINTFNIDPDKIEEKITKKTKAIMVMHYGGQPANMSKILKIARKHGLVVIEDAATAIGAEYKGKKVGVLGDLTSFSFHPIKNISTGDGGLVTTNNKKYAAALSYLRLHGMSKDAWKRHSASGSWKYDIVAPGYKYNMTDIAAALGIHQLKKLDTFIKVREEYAQIYNHELSEIPEIKIPYVDADVKHARNLYTILIDTQKLTISRNDIVEELKKVQIGANVYYIPLYEMSYYKKRFNLAKSDFPVIAKLYPEMLTLPLYPKMTKDDVHYVISSLKNIIEKSQK